MSRFARGRLVVKAALLRDSARGKGRDISMEQRASMITLGVRDLARARQFYEQGLGWERANSEEEVAFYQIGGMILGLYGWDALAEDAQVPAEGSGFRGTSIAFNTRSKDEVDARLAEAVTAGAKLVKPAEEVFWGGYSGYFADPDGHLWEVAWNPFWTVGADGAMEMVPAG